MMGQASLHPLDALPRSARPGEGLLVPSDRRAGGLMAAKYGSGKVTPAQRGHFEPMTQDGNYAAPWAAGIESVENAHDQQAAPTHALEGAVNSNATNRLTPAPVADRAAVSDEA